MFQQLFHFVDFAHLRVVVLVELLSDVHVDFWNDCFLAEFGW